MSSDDSGFIQHMPVLSDEVRRAFSFPPGRILDATAGGGGHCAILLELGHEVLAMDRDPEAVARLEEKFRGLPGISVLHERFSRAADHGPFDGILVDLGFSSFQIDAMDRGFSFRSEAPPDMRMDTSTGVSARELIESSSPEELARIIRLYGEEKRASSVARVIAGQRFESCQELAEAISGPARAFGPGANRIHPATRTFQALRIAVNGELEEITNLIKVAPTILRPGGRIAVISFHSLEDRIVKRGFSEWLGRCRCPPNLPICRCGAKAIARPLWKGSLVADKKETTRNPRARSARIRAMEMLGFEMEAEE